MKQAHGWMKWMSALVVSTAATACGVTVSEPIQSRSAASPLSATLLVKDLSTSEATAWCAWYNGSAFPGFVSPTGGPEPVEVSDGFTCPGGSSQGTMCGNRDTNMLCAQTIATAQCVQNLQRRPCEAPIAELDACVHAVLHPLEASPTGDCVDTCAVFRGRPSCDETIVQDVNNQPTGEPATACSGMADYFPVCRIPVD